MRFFLRTIILTILFVNLSLCLNAQPVPNERPRLIIGIMIDGLQQKHIDMLWNYFDPNGFKKIISQSANCRNVSYNIVSAGNASDIASVMSGSTPYYNGVVGNIFYNRNDDEIQSILEDDGQVGIGTNQNVSAHKLLSSTVVDELMLAYPDKSKSYVVAQILLGNEITHDDIEYIIKKMEQYNYVEIRTARIYDKHVVTKKGKKIIDECVDSIVNLKELIQFLR